MFMIHQVSLIDKRQPAICHSSEDGLLHHMDKGTEDKKIHENKLHGKFWTVPHLTLIDCVMTCPFVHTFVITICNCYNVHVIILKNKVYVISVA
jgi:hypothetical protein